MPFFACVPTSASEVSGTWSAQGGAVDTIDAVQLNDTKRLRLDGNGVANPNTGEINGSMSTGSNIFLMGSTNPLSNPPTTMTGGIAFNALPAGFTVTSLFLRVILHPH
jgi:hypothetical protein